MIQETEDDRLDQSLRDTFSDFDLPPSSHVWAGIESQLSALPGTPRPVPLLLVLPLVGLVGVTVGWLLPRPVTLSPVPQPSTEAAVKTRTASFQSQLPASQEAAYIIPRSSTEALAFGPVSKPVTNLVGKAASKPTKPAAWYKPQPLKPASRPAPQPESIASANTTTLTDTLPISPVSSAEELLPSLTNSVVPVELPTVAQAAPMANQQALDEAVAAAPPANYKAEPSSKGEGLRERRPEYRVPTHRLAERGRGLRRIQTHLLKHWQHLFGPRRARAGAQPDF